MELFCSRQEEYRSPCGAVLPSTQIHYRIRLPRELQCSGAYLCIHADGERAKPCDMFWCGMDGTDAEFWECHDARTQAGLYFYHFELRTAHGFQALYAGPGGFATFSSREEWQLTVYEHDCPDVRAAFGGGILYQIFPDRFFCSGTPKNNVPTDRILHQSPDELPLWQADAEGNIPNNDFYGGDLQGIIQKLPYLRSLGVTCLYVNPIFESHSNHRYDTADYSRIDPLLGTEEDLRALCTQAHALGIRILLDGVFSHTGSDSVYFNRSGRYPSVGAYQSKESPYASWYRFTDWPDQYDCWWHVRILPNVNETDPAYDKFITGEGGIAEKWLLCGADGWRLDVADELPDAFLDHFYARVKQTKPDALVLGEVWEDASNKTAYGERRRYLQGGQLHSVMNYPFRDAILGFFTGEASFSVRDKIEGILEHYPPDSLALLMNHIGTHDTDRVLHILGGLPSTGHDKAWQAAAVLTPAQRETALRLLKAASLMQFTLPGMPCIYYGDEAGLAGSNDPFNRLCYPWGQENAALLDWYRALGRLRTEYSVFAGTACRFLDTPDDLLAYVRTSPEQESLLLVFNRSTAELTLPLLDGCRPRRVLLGSGVIWPESVVLPAQSGTAFLL